ncbi:hypothetical protein F5Y05DRAFT_152622 [Hypoxylon sp. FL0543]|nr:hypothetical protein F5Y05DRAFT_152622 [Hypoxylon sp. FL0543]
MERQSEVEILIHIGAPSRAVDDTWYRSLAASYIDFQPTSRVTFPSHDSSGPHVEDGGRELDDQGTYENPTEIISISTSQPSSEPLGAFRSPQASFQSVLDNAGSPRLPARRVPTEYSSSPVEETTAPKTPSPWQSPSSVVQDSYLGNPMDLSTTLTSPTRILEHYLQQYDSPSPSPRTTSQESGNFNPRGNSSQEHTQPSSENKLPTLVIPCTPPVVPCTPHKPSPSLEVSFVRDSVMEHQEGQTNQLQPAASQNEVSSDQIIEETVIVSSGAPSVARADSEPPPNKRHQSSLADIDPRALSRSASDIGPRASNNQKATLTVTFLSEHGYTYDSLELVAPEPPAAMTEIGPTSLITPGLERLAEDLNIPKRYRPKEQTRDLRPTERGYWLVDCSTWSSQLKRDAWAYLANYVGTGVAGWGVWCTRDSDFRWIRVYCWGSVTAHIYLLLYLASQRRILYTGTSWVDGEGLTVILMETRD